MESKIKRGRGRPKEDHTFEHNLNIRLDGRDMYKLNKIAEVSGTNKSDIFRVALHGYYIYLKETGKIND